MRNDFWSVARTGFTRPGTLCVGNWTPRWSMRRDIATRSATVCQATRAVLGRQTAASDERQALAIGNLAVGAPRALNNRFAIAAGHAHAGFAPPVSAISRCCAGCCSGRCTCPRDKRPATKGSKPKLTTKEKQQKKKDKNASKEAPKTFG